MIQYFGDHLVRFVLFIATANDAQRVAVAQLAPQLFVEHVGVVGDQGVGGLENARRRAVVLLQFDDFQARKILMQLYQIFRPRTAPGVDGLVVVPDHGEPAAHADQLLHQQVLAGVGVLVFIDQQVV